MWSDATTAASAGVACLRTCVCSLPASRHTAAKSGVSGQRVLAQKGARTARCTPFPTGSDPMPKGDTLQVTTFAEVRNQGSAMSLKSNVLQATTPRHWKRWRS
ncbi:hypothetical protein EDD16DRAFT_1729183 [Pisolithus croceorrhizus]|nr:hypothetical protein EDD16DRAFT_1729183 [Pisolithus croceorrhizus]